jgi:light-regulated signal transduction histidine kinase (bacteriophytochrome)
MIGAIRHRCKRLIRISIEDLALGNLQPGAVKEIEERKASEERVKLLNEQLVANNESLKQMNEELDQFAYMASHDLQEPLRKIQVFSDKILRNNNFDPDNEKYFGKIINSSKRMQKLINNLLDFSRHTVSSSDFKKTPLN